MTFKTGQKVVCVSSHSAQRVIKGQLYTVGGIDYLKCGCMILDVGIRRTPPKNVVYCHIKCRHCGYVPKTILKNQHIIYIQASLFRPLDDMKAVSLEILEKFAPLEEKSDVNIRENEPTTIHI